MPAATPEPAPTAAPTVAPTPPPPATPAPTAAPPAPTATPVATPLPSPSSSPAPAALPSPAPAAIDATRPAFGRLTGVSPVRAGNARTVGATVTDNRALRRLELRVDGRLLRAWTLAGTRTVRSTTVPAGRLPPGRHLVRWTARDAAGNVRSTSFWLYVR